METYKLYYKMPVWLFAGLLIGYSIMSVYVIVMIALVLKTIHELTVSEKLVAFVSQITLVSLNLLGWYVIIASRVPNNYRYIINKDGIYNNQFNLIIKFLSWNNELYYCITDSFMGLYKSKMAPLDGELVNEKGITNGYLSIKSKKALHVYRDNKGWIVISTKFLQGDIHLDDLIDMINKARQQE